MDEAAARLKETTNEVLRKIGRNLLLFQQIEGMLKFLLTNGQMHGPVSALPSLHARRATSLQKQTMGQLVGQFVDDFMSDAGDDTGMSEPLQEPWLSFTFKIQSDCAVHDQLKSDFAAMVVERNGLIHHLLPAWSVQSQESTLEIDRYLDRQRQKVLPIFEHLKSDVSLMRDCQRTVAEFLESAEGKKYFELSWLQQSRLVILLGDIATQMARPDGWLPLATAGHVLRLYAAEEVSALKERYGFTTLKKLLLASELFDVRDEPTEKGGVRTIYRIKPQEGLNTGYTEQSS
jgi:hypothetical protein